MSHPCEEQAEGTASASRPPAWPELAFPGHRCSKEVSCQQSWLLVPGN